MRRRDLLWGALAGVLGCAGVERRLPLEPEISWSRDGLLIHNGTIGVQEVRWWVGFDHGAGSDCSKTVIMKRDKDGTWVHMVVL